jgi:Flp pilus assembly protein CpaB
MSGSMSRRGRAVAFLGLALVAAALAAAIADGYGSSVVRGYGALRPVVVAAAGLPSAKAIGPAQVSTGLEVRRVPERFVPPGALAAPEEALGLVPAVALPAGSYLLASQLHPPRRKRGGDLGLGPARHPVEISVSGADALLAGGPVAAEAKVDVVVTTEPSGPGRARTYVAAAGVPLIGLGPGDDGPGPGGLAAATLGLTRSQALQLIAAESFARQVTLIPVE